MRFGDHQRMDIGIVAHGWLQISRPFGDRAAKIADHDAINFSNEPDATKALELLGVLVERGDSTATISDPVASHGVLETVERQHEIHRCVPVAGVVIAD